MEEILRAFADFRETLFGDIQRLNDYLDGKHDSNKTKIDASEDALCEMSTDLDKRLGDLEDAICAMSDDSTSIGDAGTTGTTDTKEA